MDATRPARSLCDVTPLGRIVLLALVALVASVALTGCKRRHHVVVQTAKVREGRALYARYCALCHGKKAQGYAADHANAIGNAEFLAITTDDQLRRAIIDGRPGTPMSSWGVIHRGPLTPKDVDALTAYLRSFARRTFLRPDDRQAIGDAQRGAAVYAGNCASCHGARGEGSTKATSLTHPNFLRAVNDGYLRHVIERGRRGTPMPSFAAFTPQTIDDLVVYLRTLEAMPTPPPPPNFEPPPGLDQLVINKTGVPPTLKLREGRFVASADVAKALEEKRKMVILDARATPDWQRGHIVGALPFPFYDVDKLAKTLPRDGTWIVAYCACPHAASGHVVDELRKRGFTNTAVLDEGIMFWTSKGYPTVQAKIIEEKR